MNGPAISLNQVGVVLKLLKRHKIKELTVLCHFDPYTLADGSL